MTTRSRPAQTSSSIVAGNSSGDGTDATLHCILVTGDSCWPPTVVVHEAQQQSMLMYDAASCSGNKLRQQQGGECEAQLFTVDGLLGD
jgi:hypothetical protein